VFVDGHTRTKYKLGTRAAGPYKALSRGDGTFALHMGRYPETVSSDHVRRCLARRGIRRRFCRTSGYPKTSWSP